MNKSNKYRIGMIVQPSSFSPHPWGEPPNTATTEDEEFHG